MTKRHMKRLSMLLIIREIEIKTTMRYHFIPVRIVKVKVTQSCRLFMTPWTIQSMEFSRPEYWSG